MVILNERTHWNTLEEQITNTIYCKKENLHKRKLSNPVRICKRPRNWSITANVFRLIGDPTNVIENEATVIREEKRPCALPFILVINDMKNWWHYII